MNFEYQNRAIEHLRKWKVGALFMEPGTGKTKVAIDLVNMLQVSMVLWIGPLRTIKPLPGLPSIIDEISKWGGFNVPTHYVGIESIQSSDRIYNNTLQLIEGVHGVCVIVDESIKIKNLSAKRTLRAIKLSQYAEYKIILNGTPLSRNILDIYSQMLFLSPRILNMSQSRFKNTFCNYTQIRKGNRVVNEYINGYENIDYLYSLIRHYVYECDLNLRIKQQYVELPYKIGDEEREEYYAIKEYYLSLDTLNNLNNNIFMEMTQKMQMAYSVTEPKFDALDNLFKTIDQSETIIYCKYIVSREACEARYPEAKVLSYQRESLGLNLQQYRNTVYFDKIWDYALKIQASRRTYRAGQEYDCRYWDMTGNVGLENLIDQNIDKKIGMVEYFKRASKDQLRNEL